MFVSAAVSQIEDGVGRFPSEGLKNDSVAPVRHSDPAWQYASTLMLGSDSFFRWDSSFIQVQRYNLLIQRAKPFVDLGTTASPHKDLLPQQRIAPGFNTGLNPYTVYNKTPDSARFYRALVPLSRFYYTQGGNGVFILDALHTQNFSPGWNVMVDFRSVQNGEIYTSSNQNHLHRASMVGSNFVSKSGKYKNQVILSWNRARRLENRGLEIDTLFFRPGESTIRKGGNYVPESVSASSFYAQRHHKIEQQFKFNSTAKIYVFHRFDWIKQKYEYTETANLFSDKDSSFYGKNPLFQTGEFKDSSVWIQWNNSLGLGSSANKWHLPIQWKLWYAYDYIAYNTKYKTSSNLYQNQSLHAQIHGNDMGLDIHLLGDYYIAGWNESDYNLKAEFKYNLNNHVWLSGNLQSLKQRPGFVSERFSSNYIQYFIKRNQIISNSGNLAFRWQNKFIIAGLSASGGKIQNFLYADTLGIFNQASNLNYLNTEGYLRLKLGKFYLENKFTWQSHNQQKLVPFPVFTNLTGLYFQGNLFKKAMYSRIGFDIWYMSSYNGYKYNPMNVVFYPGSEKVANYPWVDFYVSGEVKTIMLFIKTEHINESLQNVGFNNRYYSAIGYPTEPFRLRFGFIWRFYN